MSKTYVNNEAVAALIRKLDYNDPAQRLESIKSLGEKRAFVALPFLVSAIENADHETINAIRKSLSFFFPLKGEVERIMAGKSPDIQKGKSRDQRYSSRLVISAFSKYALNKMGQDSGSGKPMREKDMIQLCNEYFGSFGHYSSSRMNNLSLSGAMAVGAIKRYLETPNVASGAKEQAFQDAVALVKKYQQQIGVAAASKK